MRNILSRCPNITDPRSLVMLIFADCMLYYCPSIKLITIDGYTKNDKVWCDLSLSNLVIATLINSYFILFTTGWVVNFAIFQKRASLQLILQTIDQFSVIYDSMISWKRRDSNRSFRVVNFIYLTLGIVLILNLTSAWSILSFCPYMLQLLSMSVTDQF